MANLHDPSYPINPSDEDLACMEDKRLNRLGIDPDSDPVSIMREVDRRYKGYKALRQEAKVEPFSEEQRAGAHPPGH